MGIWLKLFSMSLGICVGFGIASLTSWTYKKIKIKKREETLSDIIDKRDFSSLRRFKDYYSSFRLNNNGHLESFCKSYLTLLGYSIEIKSFGQTTQYMTNKEVGLHQFDRLFNEGKQKIREKNAFIVRGSE